jgi:hypothetical protein
MEQLSLLGRIYHSPHGNFDEKEYTRNGGYVVADNADRSRSNG